MSIFWLWLIFKADQLCELFKKTLIPLFSITTILAMFTVILAIFIYNSGAYHFSLTCLIILSCLNLASFIIVILLPTTKQLAAIYIVPKIINSSIIQETLPNEIKELYGLAKDYFKILTEGKE